MNILMLAKDSEVGGILSCVKSLSDGLVKAGDKVIVGTCAGDGVDIMLSEHDARIMDFASKSPMEMLRVYRQIKKVVKENQIDIIHAQNRIPALYASVYCFFHRKVKYIWSNHLVPIPCSFLYRLTTRYGKFAVAEGTEGKNFLIEKFKVPESKVKVVNLGSHLEKFQKTSVETQEKLKEQLDIKKGQKVILLYGRLMPVKGHMFLLEALANLPKEKREELCVIFPGQNEEYKQEVDACAKKLGLENLLIYPGYINGQEYLSITDLMVLPSIKEGFGIVNVEAFAMGVPVVRTKTAGYLDMQDCCFGVEYGDTKALTEYIDYLWESPDKLHNMAETALKNVQRFSVEKMTEEYRKIYQESLQ